MQQAILYSKGFLFESDDTSGPILCRDVRGFQAALDAARDRSKTHSGRLLIVVPDLAMEDWLARWAEDVTHSRRTVTITRRTDGSQVRVLGTLLAYGYGVDTTIRIERLEHSARASGVRRSAGVEVEPAPKSGVRDVAGSTHHHALPGKGRASR